MFKNNGPQGELNGFIDRGSRFQGELHFDAAFRIDGKFAGSVRSDGRLVVGEGGEVDAELRVRQVLVSGEVRGSIHAGEQLQIAAGGRVFADITTPSLVIEDGAIFEGRCTMTREEPAAAEAADSGPKLVSHAAGEGAASG